MTFLYRNIHTCGNDGDGRGWLQPKVEELLEGHLGLKEDVTLGHQRRHRALGPGLQDRAVTGTQAGPRHTEGLLKLSQASDLCLRCREEHSWGEPHLCKPPPFLLGWTSAPSTSEILRWSRFQIWILFCCPHGHWDVGEGSKC